MIILGFRTTHAEIRLYWSQINWSLQDCEIAAQTGRPQGSVAAARRRYGFPKSPKHGKHRFHATKFQKYATLNWANSNSHLGRLTGLSSERMRQIRSLLGLPPSTH